MIERSEVRVALLLLVIDLCLFGGVQPAASAEPPVGPLTPEQAIAAFQVAPGLRIELVAAEPLVVDPVAIAFDEDGRLWVVEMRDYPNGPAPGEPPASRIRVLEDRDGDGRFDHSRIFADRLLFANGVLPWKGGVLATVSGEILYLKDTDGDGRADRRDVLFRGFAEQNPQLRVNHPTLGIDNWVYVANGLRGGAVVRADDPGAEAVSLSGMDFRFDPSSDRYEAISGMGQFGLTFDDWGNRFVCSNRNHNRHVVLPASAIRRNPFLAVPDTAEDTPVHGAASEVFPLSRNWTTSTLHTGTFTAACGVTVYRGDLLPVEFHGNSFTCEPTGNLVHRDVLEPAGATFRARRAREGVEFLASPDEWFRPVNLADGPDGALYVVDMYRAVIEHPEFMPPELKDRPDLVDGNDRGRIWRLVPLTPIPLPLGEGRVRAAEGWQAHARVGMTDSAESRKRRRLSDASPEELTGLLAHPNGWWRQTAQRLLVERQAPGSVDALRFMVGAAQDPRARIHAAWTLAGLGELDQYLLLRLLGDDDPRVREHGVRLAEGKPADLPLVQKCVIELTGDADPRVRFQAALCLGEIDGDEIVEPLAAVALRDVSDRWTRLAVASAVPQRAGALVSRLLGRDHAARCDAAEDQRTLVQELSTLVGSRQDPSEIATVLGAIAGLGSGSDRSAASSSERAVIFMQIAAVAGLAEGADRRGKPFADLLRLFPEDDRLLADRIGDVFRAASNLAADREMLPEERERATRLLAHAPERIGGEVLAELVHGPDEPPALRVAAVQALAMRRDPAASSLLLAGWKSYSPSVRNAVADALTRSPERIGALLDAIETGIVRPSELGPGPTRQIASERLPEELRTRASRLIARPTSADRGQVVGRYQSALELAPNVEHGRAVFEKNCATCHRVAGTGVDVGPDIADSRTRTPEALLVDILNPNAAIDANYVSYTLVTQSGRLLSGVIASETASSVTLRRAENVTDVVLRQDIDEMRSDGTSLMPEGLEKDLTIQDVADLIGFLKNWRYVDAAVRPDAP